MINEKLESRPTFSSFLLIWVMNSALVWAAVVFLALLFAGESLHRGLVPAPILLVLAGMPVVIFTGLIQGLLYLAAKRLRRESRKFCNLLIVLGAAPLTLLTLWLVTLFLGGADFFIPRL